MERCSDLARLAIAVTPSALIFPTALRGWAQRAFITTVGQFVLWTLGTWSRHGRQRRSSCSPKAKAGLTAHGSNGPQPETDGRLTCEIHCFEAYLWQACSYSGAAALAAAALAAPRALGEPRAAVPAEARAAAPRAVPLAEGRKRPPAAEAPLAAPQRAVGQPRREEEPPGAPPARAGRPKRRAGRVAARVAGALGEAGVAAPREGAARQARAGRRLRAVRRAAAAQLLPAERRARAAARVGRAT